MVIFNSYVESPKGTSEKNEGTSQRVETNGLWVGNRKPIDFEMNSDRAGSRCPARRRFVGTKLESASEPQLASPEILVGPAWHASMLASKDSKAVRTCFWDLVQYPSRLNHHLSGRWHSQWKWAVSTFLCFFGEINLHLFWEQLLECGCLCQDPSLFERLLTKIFLAEDSDLGKSWSFGTLRSIVLPLNNRDF